MRIEDSLFQIKLSYMQCSRKRKYKNFLFCNHGAKPTLQDATPPTGRSRFAPPVPIPRSSTTGLDYSILVRWNFGLVMLWDRFIFLLSTILHQRNFEIVSSILVGSEPPTVGQDRRRRGSLRILTDRFDM